jgi:heme exporter protein C
MWGTWWVWDARLTSELVLFFLYLGYIALVNGFDDRQRGIRAASVLALVGWINVPIIKFSVDWWNSLHQPASVLRLGGPTMASVYLVPLLLAAIGFTLLFSVQLILRMRAALIERKVQALKMLEAEQGGGAAYAAPTMRPEAV